MKRARVLVIDDDAELLEILGEWLALRGHSVKTLSNGLEAPEAARAFRPNVVLLDAVLRGTSGPAVAERLRAEGQEGIVYLSGLPRNRLPSDAPVLAKPIDLDVLDRTIQGFAP